MTYKKCNGYNGYCCAPEEWLGEYQPCSHFLIKTGKYSNYCKWCRRRAAGYTQDRRARKGLRKKEDGTFNPYRDILWEHNLDDDCLGDKCPIYYPTHQFNGRLKDL